MFIHPTWSVPFERRKGNFYWSLYLLGVQGFTGQLGITIISGHQVIGSCGLILSFTGFIFGSSIM
jgi:hypothetical protein